MLSPINMFSQGQVLQQRPDLARRLRLAEAMSAQSVDTSPIQSPFQGLARLAQAFVGNKKAKDVETQVAGEQSNAAQLLAKAMSGGGTPDYASLVGNPLTAGIGVSGRMQQAQADRARAEDDRKYARGRQDQIADAARQFGQAKELAALQLENSILAKTDPRYVKAQQDIAAATTMADLEVAMAKMVAENQMRFGPQGGQPAPGTQMVSGPEQAPTVGSLGAPLPDANPLEGLPPTEAAKLAATLREEAIKKFQAGEVDAQQARTMVQDLDRFVSMVEGGMSTGGQYKIPGAESVMGAFDPQVAEAKAIVDKMTPLMRKGMPGAASDRDVAMFRGATVGLDKPAEANVNIARGLMVANQNALEKRDFEQAYFDQNKHLQGAERAWNKYLNDNPIFLEGKNYSLNPRRQDWRTYFSGGGAKSTPVSNKSGIASGAGLDQTLDYGKMSITELVGSNPFLPGVGGR